MQELNIEKIASARVVEIEDQMSAWVRKLNRLAAEIDGIWDSTHPAVAEALTANLSQKYRAIAANMRAMPNSSLQERNDNALRRL